MAINKGKSKKTEQIKALEKIKIQQKKICLRKR